MIARCLDAGIDHFDTADAYNWSKSEEILGRILKGIAQPVVVSTKVGASYGHVPEGHEKSITEMEYERAVERGIPRLIFLMGDDHDVKPKDVEKGTGGAKLDALRERLKK